MNALKIKKGPIILPLLLLAALLAGYTAMNFRGISAADSLSLGQQYLNEMDYGGAIAAFTKAIELDPTSREAHLGLARAYVGSENDELAQELLEEMVYTQDPDAEAAQELADLFEREGEIVPALQVVQTMIDATDEEAYYTRREELLASLAETPRLFAEGTDQQLVIQDGKVLSRGNNMLGQLGLDPAAVADSQQFLPADYAGTPLKVACVGRTSFVIDTNGSLWAAGENRWGQMGAGYGITAPQAGWGTQIPAPGAAADVAGTTGRVLVLLADGSLWSAGAGTSQELQRIQQFPMVVGISSSPQLAAVLTVDGVLYQSPASDPGQWSLTARNVRSFHIFGDTLCWVTEDNCVSNSFGDAAMYMPEEWYQEETGMYIPPFQVADAVQAGSRLILTDQNGGLYTLSGNGAVTEVPLPDAVANLYTQNETVVLELEDGSVQLMWDDDGPPQPLEV